MDDFNLWISGFYGWMPESIYTRNSMKKITWIILLLLAAIILAACQANYIRDVQGGTVSPSSSAELTGLGGWSPMERKRTLVK